MTDAQVARYGILAMFSRESDVDYLFSGGDEDPEVHAWMDADMLFGVGSEVPRVVDVRFEVTAFGTVVTRAMMFGSAVGLENYVRENQ